MNSRILPCVVGCILTLAGCAMSPGQVTLTPERGFIAAPVQLTFPTTFIKAGEAYFNPDASWVIFQAIPVPPEGEPAPANDDYTMYVAKVRRNGAGGVTGLHAPFQISPPLSANTCGWFHPTMPGVVLFGSTITKPAGNDTAGYKRETGKYEWRFPREMEIVSQTVTAIVNDLVTDPQRKADLLSRRDVDRPRPIWGRDGYDAEGSWSPDARSIVYTRIESQTNGGDLWVYLPERDEHRPLVQEAGYDGGPFFSPDGEWICYRSDRAQNDLLQIFVAKLSFDENGLPDGIEREIELTDNEHVNWCPFWHPSGRYLIYATSEIGHHNYEIFSIAAPGHEGMAGRQTHRVTYGDGFDGLPVFSNDATLLMWTAQRGADGSTQLFAAPLNAATPPALAAAVAPQVAAAGIGATPIADAFASVGPDVRRFDQHVTTLANPYFEGRLPGSKGIERAEAYIQFCFEEVGLEPAFPDYRQSFTMRKPDPENPHATTGETIVATNMGAILPGRGDLAGEYIIVGGHHDHIGRGEYSSRGEIGRWHNGADDNASGTAAVLMLAESLERAYDELPPRAEARSVLFLTFSAEEAGLNGSRHYVENPIDDISKHVLMVNFDMVGRSLDGHVEVAGLGSGVGLDAVLRPVFKASDLAVNLPDGLSGRSDHASFYDAEVPVLFVMTGDLHADYHTDHDDSWKVNRVGAAMIIDLMHDVVLAAAITPGKYPFLAIPGANMSGGTGPAAKVRFGIMPGNYNDTEPGVDVQRVSADTSAEKGGIIAGDRIMTWNGTTIETIGAWTAMLSKHEPGDIVRIGVLRDGEMIELDVELFAK